MLSLRIGGDVPCFKLANWQGYVTLWSRGLLSLHFSLSCSCSLHLPTRRPSSNTLSTATPRLSTFPANLRPASAGKNRQASYYSLVSSATSPRTLRIPHPHQHQHHSSLDLLHELLLHQLITHCKTSLSFCILRALCASHSTTAAPPLLPLQRSPPLHHATHLRPYSLHRP